MPDNYIDGGWGCAVPGVHDIVSGDQIIRNLPNRIVFVNNASQVEMLNNEPVGTFAATYGFKQMWQYDGNLNWVNMTGGSDVELPSIETIPAEGTSDEPTFGG